MAEKGLLLDNDQPDSFGNASLDKSIDDENQTSPLKKKPKMIIGRLHGGTEIDQKRNLRQGTVKILINNEPTIQKTKNPLQSLNSIQELNPSSEAGSTPFALLAHPLNPEHNWNDTSRIMDSDESKDEIKESPITIPNFNLVAGTHPKIGTVQTFVDSSPSGTNTKNSKISPSGSATRKNYDSPPNNKWREPSPIDKSPSSHKELPVIQISNVDTGPELVPNRRPQKRSQTVFQAKSLLDIPEPIPFHTKLRSNSNDLKEQLSRSGRQTPENKDSKENITEFPKTLKAVSADMPLKFGGLKFMDTVDKVMNKEIKKTSVAKTTGTFKYNIEDDGSGRQVIMPEYTDKELDQFFQILDRDKDGYMNVEDLRFYFTLLEEPFTDRDLEEMIRMIDYEGTDRARFDEFYRMATGMNVNPMGYAYPPTMDLFMLKKENHVDETPFIIGTDRELFDDKPKENYTNVREYELIEAKLSELPKLGDMQEEVRSGYGDKEHRDALFRYFIKRSTLSEARFLDKYKDLKLLEDQKMMKYMYKDYLIFFEVDDFDFAKAVFQSISAEKGHIDLRLMMSALLMYLPFGIEEKIEMIYNLFDNEANGYIVYVELLKILQTLLYGADPKRVEKKVKVILNKGAVKK